MNLLRKNTSYDVQEVRQDIQIFSDGPHSSVGYRSVWHSLKLNDRIILCLIVQNLVKELEPKGDVKVFQSHVISFNKWLICTVDQGCKIDDKS